MNLGIRYYYARQYERAIDQFRQTLEMERTYTGAHYWLGLALTQAKRYPEAIAELGKVEGPSVAGPLGYAYAAAGRTAEARGVVDDLTPLAGVGTTGVSPFDLAVIWAGLGGKDQALGWLDKALAGRSSEMIFIAVDPMLDGLRSDPRFAALARRVGVAG